MSEETELLHQAHKTIPPANLSQKALDFVCEVSAVLERVIDEMESNQISAEKGHALLRHIAADIRLELTTFPTTHDEELEIACYRCLPNYNNCKLPHLQCIENYSTCVHICT